MKKGKAIGWRIHGSSCGRDKQGNFHCVCGDCEPFHEGVGQLKTFELDVQKGTCFVNGINIAEHTSALELEFENGEWSLHFTKEYLASSVSVRANQ